MAKTKSKKNRDSNQDVEPKDVEARDEALEETLDVTAAIDVDVELNDDTMEVSVLEATEGVEGTELENFDSAEVEEIEEITDEELTSAVESLLFATDKPQSVAVLKSAFQGVKVKVADIRRAIEKLQMEYANPIRGVTLEEVAGGYQIRTKMDNQVYLQRTVKARPFRLSGPALEVLSIVAYKQPCPKFAVDEVRGVESGHLMRGLLDRGLLTFAGKSELPGRPMQYETTRKFLEIFGLRNINELPTLNEIDQLIPEGIGEVAEEKETLSDLTGNLSTDVVARSYSENEDELMDIASELQAINTSSDFFDAEKRRQKAKRDADRAQDITERLAVGEEVEEKDKRWLAKYELEMLPKAEEVIAIEHTNASFPLQAPLENLAVVVEDVSIEVATQEPEEPPPVDSNL